MKKLLVGLFASVGFLCVLLGIALIVVFKDLQNQKPLLPEKAVLVLNFKGALPESSRSDNPLHILQGTSSSSLYDVVRALDYAATDPKIEGVVGLVGDGEMGVAQIQEIRSALTRFRMKSARKKYTIAYADTFGEFSQGTLPYYLASAFDDVWMQPLGVVGFTGLSFEIPFARHLLDTLGLKPLVGKRKEYKNFFDTFTEVEFTEAHKESMKSLIKGITHQILSDVALSREMPIEDVKDAMDESPLLAKEAHKRGLIDKIAPLSDLKEKTKTQDGKSASLVSVQDYLNYKDDEKKREFALKQVEARPRIALIHATGTIRRGTTGTPSFLGGVSFSGREIASALEEAAKDPTVKGVVLRINCGGGSPVASETIWNAIHAAKKAGKPLVASLSDYAASGGYWIATAADKIILHSGTITGSIGVVGGKMLFKGFFDHLGVNWEAVSEGRHARLWSNTKEYSSSDWAKVNHWLDHIYESFIEKVSKGRGLSPAHVHQIAKGRPWTGEEAFRYGLCDGIGDLQTAIELAAKEGNLDGKDYEVALYPETLPLFERLLQQMLNKEEATDSFYGVEEASSIYSFDGTDANWVSKIFNGIQLLKSIFNSVFRAPKIQ